MKRIGMYIPLAFFIIFGPRGGTAAVYNDVALPTSAPEQGTIYIQRLAASTPQDIPSQAPVASGKLSKPASKLLIKTAPSAKGPGAIVIPRENCGTHWTAWVDDPNGDVNPCPSGCERGEREILNSHRTGDKEQYQARYQCYLPELVVNQPAGALREPGSPTRQNCGTHWTGWVADPNADVNPCPSNCERGELQVVNRNRSGKGLQYNMRYQCYVAEPAMASMAPASEATEAHPVSGTPQGTRLEGGETTSSSSAIKNSETKKNSRVIKILPLKKTKEMVAITGEDTTSDTVHPVTGTPQGVQVAGAQSASTSMADEATPAIALPAAAGRTISTEQLNAPGTTITAIADITSTTLTVKWKPVTGASGYTPHAAAKGLNLTVDGAEVKQPMKLLGELSAPLAGLAPEIEHTVWVSVHYPDGKLGTSDEKSVTLLAAKNPEGFKATYIGPGAVRLEWQATPGALSYYVQGSNLPRRQTTQTYEIVSNLPSGMHEWTLVAVYPAGLYNDITASKTSFQIETRAEMVDRAFNAGQAKYHDGGPDPAHWKRLALATTMNYDQLVNSFASIWVVTQAYQYLLERDASAQEADRYISLLNAGRDWQDIWREIAQSNERDQRYGYWAPAPMLDVAHARQVYNQPGLRNAQACFGGLGDGCDSPEVGEPTWDTGFMLPDGTRMAFIEMNVVVGSILHDNACLRNADGLHCDNQAWHWLVEHIPLLSSAASDAAIEWNKAVWNLLDGRKWRVRFGPYPVEKSLRRANWFDDLRSIQARTAYMAPVYANITVPSQTERYTGAETRGSHAIAAPPGTAIDSKDAQFCRSGTFLKIESAFGKADWGICK